MPLLAGTAQPGHRFTAEPPQQTSGVAGGAKRICDSIQIWAFVSIYLPPLKPHFIPTSLPGKKASCRSETAHKSFTQAKTLCFHLSRLASTSCPPRPSQHGLRSPGKSTPNRLLHLACVFSHGYASHCRARGADSKSLVFCGSPVPFPSAVSKRCSARLSICSRLRPYTEMKTWQHAERGALLGSNLKQASQVCGSSHLGFCIPTSRTAQLRFG